MTHNLLTWTALFAAAALLTGCSGTPTITAGLEDVSSVPAASEVYSVSSETSDIPAESVPETAAEEPKEPVPEGMAKSSLTGEYIDQASALKRPVAFMIDNVNGADPPSGISEASLYYEAPVETDLSRICAVFEDMKDLKKIGPLRSCRDYFISLSAGLDPIYTHYGQAAYALPYLESDSVDNISGLMGYGDLGFFRSNAQHKAPHNAYTSAEGMEKMIAHCAYRREHTSSYTPEYTFTWVGETENLSQGEEAAFVAPGYPYNKPSFVYDPSAHLYTRSQYGRVHTDVENNTPLTVRNIILEYENGALYQNSLYWHFDTASKGRGKYITEGKAVSITWERKDFYSPVVYRYEDGSVVKLNTGKSWICVIRNDAISSCMIGADETSAHCAEDAQSAEALISENQAYTASYKQNEETYLSQMAHLREELVRQHGKSKVE